jgi:hypothetical protein
MPVVPSKVDEIKADWLEQASDSTSCREKAQQDMRLLPANQEMRDATCDLSSLLL